MQCDNIKRSKNRQRGLVGAGSVVTHSVPPYGIACGNPAKIIKFRFNSDANLIYQNEEVLYHESKRLTKNDIEDVITKYNKTI
jgi:acyl-[acyl carrier protein]--UDP-N-acetylglucosamine O-acyltransferase